MPRSLHLALFILLISMSIGSFAGQAAAEPAIEIRSPMAPTGWALLERAVLRAGSDVAIENVPMPKLAVATQVKLASAKAADRHADLREVRAAIHLSLAAGRERSHPFRRELFVGGHKLFEVSACERPGHGVLPGTKSQRRRRARPEEFQKVAPGQPAKAGLGGRGFDGRTIVTGELAFGMTVSIHSRVTETSRGAA